MWMDFFAHPLCVENCKKGAVSAFCPVLWNASVCILYADGLFLAGMRRLRALLSGIIFVSAVDFPMIFYAAVVFAWFMISQTIDRISGHRLPIGMKYRDTWVYAALVIVVIHFVVKNLFYIKTGVEPFL